MKKLLCMLLSLSAISSPRLLCMDQQSNKNWNTEQYARNAQPLSTITNILNHNFPQYLSHGDFSALRRTCKHLHSHIFAGYQLHDAVARGKLSDVRILIAAGANVNEINLNGKTPLGVLLEYTTKDNTRSLALLQDLLHAGADANQKTKADVFCSCYPLHLAICWPNIPVLQMLMHAGADPKLKSFGVTPLADAVCMNNIQAVECLLAGGARDDQSEPYRTTALHHAASQGNREIMQLLLKNHPAINAKNEMGYTPLQLAVARAKSAHVVSDLLIAGAKINQQPLFNPHNSGPMDLALRQGELEIAGIVKYEINARTQVRTLYMAGYGHNSIHQSPAQHITLPDAFLILSFLREFYLH